MSKSYEVNFDGLVGPTHNYSGLSFGNVASISNQSSRSNPREAALQGLQKMKFLLSLGLKQAILPPQERPDLSTLRRVGFSGSDGEILSQARKYSPEILSAAWSGSSMWTANAATVAPSSDTADRKVHFTAANLNSKFHRSLEPETTSRMLKSIFNHPGFFVHHEPLPAQTAFGDEGAANHTRFCENYEKKGLHFFVYGRKHGAHEAAEEPKLFPARQTLEASEAIARLHQLEPSAVVFAKQNPLAIDAGVFHNDVVSVGNLNVLFYHEEAYFDSQHTLSQLSSSYEKTCSAELKLIQVRSKDINLQDAVKSYLFNSQLVATPGTPGEMALIAPSECSENPAVKSYLDSLVRDLSQPIRKVHYFDLRESMKNGGGPACLRLRVVLNEEEVAHTHAGVFLDEALYTTLCTWVKKHYRDQITQEDLVDPAFSRECKTSLDELTKLLKLGSVYSFQRTPA